MFYVSSQNKDDLNRLEIERQEVDVVELDINQNDEVVENCEGDKTLADEANPVGNWSDIVESTNVATSSSVIPFINIVLKLQNKID